MFASSYNERDNGDYFFDRNRAELRKEGFVWAAYFFAYKDEDYGYYDEIIKRWSVLDIVTGKSVAFIVCISNGSIVPYTRNRTIRKKDISSNIKIYDSNMQIIDAGEKRFKFSRDNMPCIILTNLIKECEEPIRIEVKENTNIVDIMYYITTVTEQIMNRIREVNYTIKKNYKYEEEYVDRAGRLLRIIREVDNELYNRAIDILLDVERGAFDYYEREKLNEIWKQAIGRYGNRVYGDYQKSLSENVMSSRLKISNYMETMPQYISYAEQVRELQEGMRRLISEVEIETLDHKKIYEEVVHKTNELITLLELDQCENNIVNEVKNHLETIKQEPNEKNVVILINSITKCAFSGGVKIVDQVGRVTTTYMIIKWIVYWGDKLLQSIHF